MYCTKMEKNTKQVIPQTNSLFLHNLLFYNVA
eukprot:UN13986